MVLTLSLLTVQGIWDLHHSDFPDEEKAALSVLCYEDPKRTAKGKGSNSSEELAVASNQVEADSEAGQPWGAQSPTHKASSQVNRHA